MHFNVQVLSVWKNAETNITVLFLFFGVVCEISVFLKFHAYLLETASEGNWTWKIMNIFNYWFDFFNKYKIFRLSISFCDNFDVHYYKFHFVQIFILGIKFVTFFYIYNIYWEWIYSNSVFIPGNRYSCLFSFVFFTHTKDLSYLLKILGHSFLSIAYICVIYEHMKNKEHHSSPSYTTGKLQPTAFAHQQCILKGIQNGKKKKKNDEAICALNK